MTQPTRPFPRGDRRPGRGLPRRVFIEQALRAGAVGAAALWTPGVLAQELTATPSSRSLEGPFYPDVMPLDTDNDLLIVNDSITPAVGEVTHLHRHRHHPGGDAAAQRVRRDLAVRREPELPAQPTASTRSRRPTRTSRGTAASSPT